MEPLTTATGNRTTHQSAPASMNGHAVASARITPGLLKRLAMRVTAGPGRELRPVKIPFSGETLGELPLCTADDVKEAVRRARAAQARWADRPWREKARIFMRLHDLVLERQDEVLDLIQLESGKSRPHGFEEIADVAILTRYYANHGEEHIKPMRRRGALPGLTVTWEYRHPRGVIGFIAPWNYPLTLAITDAIPALLAGNAVVLKPDRQTPFTALWIADLLYECGLPPDLFQVVTGAGTTLGAPIIQNVDFIQFTGSTETGRIIARQAGESLIACSLELGGKNPMLVLEDASVGAAVQGAVRGCFSNTGQLCISIERLFVHADLYDRFVDRFVSATRALKLGPSLAYDMEIGSLVSEAQLATVTRHVEDAVAKGATVLAGGRARPDLGPLFYEPTILSGVKEGMLVYAEETFGPVVSLYDFRTVDEAVERANATEYGLNASVWTRNVAKGRKVAMRIKAGTVNVNESYAATWASMDAPMGGFKDSGLGSRHGREGILKYTESQNVATQLLHPIAAPKGVTHDQFAKVMTGALKVWKWIPGIR